MAKLIGILVTGAALAVLSSPTMATPVTWSFYETGISCAAGTCPSTPDISPPITLPHVLASLTLRGPTSSGTASWDPGEGPVYPPPSHLGDDFDFTMKTEDLGLSELSSTRLTGPGAAGDCAGYCPWAILNYTISWTETAGHLQAVDIDILTEADELHLHGAVVIGGLANRIASDFTFGGCSFFNEVCTVSGFWQNDLTVPEPGSLALLVSGVLGALLTRRYAHPVRQPKCAGRGANGRVCPREAR